MMVSGALLLPAQTQPPDHRLRYESLRDRMYNGDEPAFLVPTYEAGLREAAAAARRGDLAAYEEAYWTALLEYMMARAWHAAGNNDRAGEHYDRALAAVEQSLGLRRSSEGLRLQSETISQLCLVRGLGYTILNGPRVAPLANEALELNPDNGKAIVILASARVYPPAIFGGNPREGIRLMEEALTKPDIETDDRFNIYSGIGIAYDKLGDRARALRYLERARAIYPGNGFVRTELERIR